MFEEKILDLAKEKAAIDDQEKRMNNISSKLSIQEIELRNRFKEVQEAKDEIGNIKQIKGELGQVASNFQEQVAE